MATPAAKPPVSPAAAPAAIASPATGTPRKFNWLLVIVPMLLLVCVGTYVAFETFRADMEARQQGQGGEARLGVVGGPLSTGERKSREVKVGTAPVPAPVTDDDEVAVLGKKKKPPPPKPAAVLTPVDRAWRSVKSDYDKLEARNETNAKKYRMRMLTLEDRKTSTAEASFVKEASALEELLRDELAKPENQ